MLRVRPGVLLVRAIFLPTSALITLDLPTLDRPRKAISGTLGAGKCVKSLADSMNRARIRMQTVSSVWVAHGKRRGKISWLASWGKTQALYQGIASAMPKVLRIRTPPLGAVKALKSERTLGFHVLFLDRMQPMPERKPTRDDQSNENTDQKKPAILWQRNEQNRSHNERDD